MKFVEISKARKLNFNEPVFTKDKGGFPGFGKLVKKEDAGKGIVWTFQMASFSYDQTEPSHSSDITHVAIP